MKTAFRVDADNKNTSILYLIVASLILATSVWAGVQVYQSTTRTLVNEDLSFNRTVRLRFNAHLKQQAAIFRDFYQTRDFQVLEEVNGGDYLITAVRTFESQPGDSSRIYLDEYSEITLLKTDTSLHFEEVFHTEFVREQSIQDQRFKKSPALAKAALAAMEFEFELILPGDLLTHNAKSIDENQLAWHYDIEDVFNHNQWAMRASTLLKREDRLLNYVHLSALSMVFFTTAVLVLMAVRNRSSKKHPPDHEAEEETTEKRKNDVDPKNTLDDTDDGHQTTAPREPA